jgi:hypothetical protein
MKTRVSYFVACVTVAGLGLCPALRLAHGADAVDIEPPRFVERPGSLEFSGQMIVRPLQPTALGELGLDPEQTEVVRKRATARIEAYVIEYVTQTDEYIVDLPANETENSYAARLMTTGDYEYAVPDWICHPTETIPNDGGYGQQWHHTQVRSSLAWDITTGDPSVIIAIVDGGIELTHPDLADALVPGYNAADRLAQLDGGDVDDVDGHGTFVAGLAGAIGNNGTHVVGMGWSFSIMPIRYYNGPGGGYLHDILDGARWAVEHGAKCINVSQTGVEYSPVETTGEYITTQGGLLFWAAGNDGRDLSWFDWEHVIVVGGTDQNDDRALCSAYGLAVDLYAPGIDILSTGIGGGLAISGCGTSASTPMAAGIGGLIWSANPCLSPRQVQLCLFSGCVDLGEPGNDTIWGWGRIDSFGAVLAATAPCGDCDGNGSVDTDDWPAFAACLEDPDAPVLPGCWCADTTGDGDVDLADFAAFQTRLTN